MLQQTTVATVGPYFDRFRGTLARCFGARRGIARRGPAALAGARLLRARPQPACLRARRRRAAWRRLPRRPGSIARTARDRRLHRGGDRRDRLRSARPRRSTAMSSASSPGSMRWREPLPAAKPRLRALAAALVPEQRAGDFAQALMDLGATICTPRRPRCVLCPWRACCAAAAAGLADALPARAEKPERPLRYGVAFWLTAAGRSGAAAPPPGEGPARRHDRDPVDAVAQPSPGRSTRRSRIAPAAAEWAPLPGTVRHGFTHFRLELAIIAGQGEADGMWSRVDRLGEHALPTLMKKVARHAISALAGRL